MTGTPVLEPAAREFASATANPPYLFDLGPDKGREVAPASCVRPASPSPLCATKGSSTTS